MYALSGGQRLANSLAVAWGKDRNEVSVLIRNNYKAELSPDHASLFELIDKINVSQQDKLSIAEIGASILFTNGCQPQMREKMVATIKGRFKQNPPTLAHLAFATKCLATIPMGLRDSQSIEVVMDFVNAASPRFLDELPQEDLRVDFFRQSRDLNLQKALGLFPSKKEALNLLLPLFKVMKSEMKDPFVICLNKYPEDKRLLALKRINNAENPVFLFQACLDFDQLLVSDSILRKERLEAWYKLREGLVEGINEEREALLKILSAASEKTIDFIANAITAGWKLPLTAVHRKGIMLCVPLVRGMPCSTILECILPLAGIEIDKVVQALDIIPWDQRSNALSSVAEIFHRHPLFMDKILTVLKICPLKKLSNIIILCVKILREKKEHPVAVVNAVRLLIDVPNHCESNDPLFKAIVTLFENVYEEKLIQSVSEGIQALLNNEAGIHFAVSKEVGPLDPEGRIYLLQLLALLPISDFSEGYKIYKASLEIVNRKIAVNPQRLITLLKSFDIQERKQAIEPLCIVFDDEEESGKDDSQFYYEFKNTTRDRLLIIQKAAEMCRNVSKGKQQIYIQVRDRPMSRRQTSSSGAKK